MATNTLQTDFFSGYSTRTSGGMRVNELSANAAVITCLANDIGYDYIYSEQLAVQAQAEDLQLVVGHMIMPWLFENRPEQSQ